MLIHKVIFNWLTHLFISKTYDKGLEHVNSIVDKVMEQVADEDEQEYFTNEIKPSTMDINNPGAPNNNIMTPIKKLEAFKNENWREHGYDLGLKSRSFEVCNNEIASLIQKFISIKLEIYEEWQPKLLKARQDLSMAGEHGEVAAIARENLAYIAAKIEDCKTQIDKDHVNDRWSECYSLVLAFRSGFNEGHNTYIKNTGIDL